jgi:hypothetical protein
MSSKGAFVLTPVGLKEGRYNVERVQGQMQASCDSRSGKVKVVKAASPRSRAAIKEIIRKNHDGLKRLADR